MKVVILAVGPGSRLTEETSSKSKAMVRIGDQPILWHIAHYYGCLGLHEFVIALGYKGESIEDYFRASGFGRVTANGTAGELPPECRRWQNGQWTADLVDTGLETQNGGRLKRLAPYLGDRTFMLTWCDGLANVDLDRLLEFHRSHGRLATLTAVHPAARFGRLVLNGNQVHEFHEKVVGEDEWINGAYFVLEPGVLDYIAGDDTRFEHDTLTRLAREGELMAYRHDAFWQCMDTLRAAQELNALWASNRAPWKIWVDPCRPRSRGGAPIAVPSRLASALLLS
jgi:glucose-1-phosphate cytidylyltransferase